MCAINTTTPHVINTYKHCIGFLHKACCFGRQFIIQLSVQQHNQPHPCTGTGRLWYRHQFNQNHYIKFIQNHTLATNSSETELNLNLTQPTHKQHNALSTMPRKVNTETGLRKNSKLPFIQYIKYITKWISTTKTVNKNEIGANSILVLLFSRQKIPRTTLSSRATSLGLITTRIHCLLNSYNAYTHNHTTDYTMHLLPTIFWLWL